jgi:4-diphosphocytidyl-2C-methyl-D-erythritol kinase
VRGGTALATGRGEKLESLPDMPDCEFIICKPDFSISTPELFRKLDQSGTRCRPDTEGILAALQAGDLGQICRRMYNVFEDLDDRRLRTVREIKGKLLDCGALGAVMTGTGSAVFSLRCIPRTPTFAYGKIRSTASSIPMPARRIGTITISSETLRPVVFATGVSIGISSVSRPRSDS